MREAALDQPVSHIYTLPAAHEHLCRGDTLWRAAVFQQVASNNAVLQWNIIVLCVCEAWQNIKMTNVSRPLQKLLLNHYRNYLFVRIMTHSSFVPGMMILH